MPEVTTRLLYIALGMAVAKVLQWLNAPWWLVVALIVGCFAVGAHRAIRNADSTYVDVYYDQPNHNDGSEAQRQGGPFG